MMIHSNLSYYYAKLEGIYAPGSASCRPRHILNVSTNPKEEEYVMPEIMTTKEVAKYLKLHEITICKYAAEGKIPAIRIGRVWRFDKEAIDRWISGGEKK